MPPTPPSSTPPNDRPSAAPPERFRAYRVEEEGGGVRASVRDDVPLASLPEHDVTVRVAWSSLNYKDALSATGNRGVTRRYPHTPGIDAAGTVLASRDPRFAPGDEVIVTSFDLGMDTPGGFGEIIRAPGDWIVPMPAGLDARSAMALGTAGLTAALGAMALEAHGLRPGDGPVLVTGASGGVGSLAVALLAGMGHEVAASTGSSSAAERLERLGASRILDRAALSEPSGRPLGKPAWAGAVDVVGGATLDNVVKTLLPGAAVAACGLVQSPELSLTVFPFILRGVALLGIDSAQHPMAGRREAWRRLAGPWRVDPEAAGMLEEIDLDGLDDAVERILRGATTGRVLVRVAG